VNRTAPGFALAFGDFRPEGDARLALGLRGGDFDALLRWLVLLDTRFGIDVVMMDVRPTDTPGRVDAGLTLMWHH
jgi:type II secretory pathway component PulM